MSPVTRRFGITLPEEAAELRTVSFAFPAERAYHMLLWDTYRRNKTNSHSLVGVAFASSTPGWFTEDGTPCEDGPVDGWADLLFQFELGVPGSECVDSDSTVRSALTFLLTPSAWDEPTEAQRAFWESSDAESFRFWEEDLARFWEN